MKMYKTLCMFVVVLLSGCTSASYTRIAPPLDISEQCTSLFPVFYELKTASCEQGLFIRARSITMYSGIITDTDEMPSTMKQEQLMAKKWALIQVLAEAKPELVIACSKEFMDYVNAGTLHIAKCDGIEDVDMLTQQAKDQQKIAEILEDQMHALSEIIFIPDVLLRGRVEYNY